MNTKTNSVDAAKLQIQNFIDSKYNRYKESIGSIVVLNLFREQGLTDIDGDSLSMKMDCLNMLQVLFEPNILNMPGINVQSMAKTLGRMIGFFDWINNSEHIQALLDIAQLDEVSIDESDESIDEVRRAYYVKNELAKLEDKMKDMSSIAALQ